VKKVIIAMLLLVIFLFSGSAKYYWFCEKVHEDKDIAAIKIDEANPNYLTLKNTSIFAPGAISDRGIIPEEIRAFGKIFEKENAVNYFYKLEFEANNQGKLYALCGLFYLDYDY